jgi:hypothetical protein
MTTSFLGIFCNGCDAQEVARFELSEAEASDLAYRMAHAQLVPEMNAMRARMHAKGWTSRPAEPVYGYQKLTRDGELIEMADLPFDGAAVDFCPECSGKLN